MTLNSALSSLLHFSTQIEDLENKNKEEELKIKIRHREKAEPLFLERQEALKQVAGFWSGVLASRETPLAELMNGTFDTKITRAVSDFQVKTRVDNGKLIHQVIMTFKPNVMLEAGTVSREVDSDGNTISVEPIKWKQGAENLKVNSLFSFFDEKPDGGDAFVDEALKAFDIVFQDPFIATVPDE